jgi:hypothetical protein
MRRFLFEVSLMIAVLFVVPSSWAEPNSKADPNSTDPHLQFTEDYPSEVASAWFDTLYQTVRSEVLRSPRPGESMASRLSPSTRRLCRVRFIIARWRVS